MSDIRFNQWLHQSGTGGVTQISSGHVGIGTTNPLIPVHSANTATLNVGIITANNIYAGTLNGTLALSNISGITGSFTSDVTINGNLDIVDKIRHIGDTNTAIRFPANDTVSIETSGSEALRIPSTGNVLIGTTTDSNNKLTLYGTNASVIMQNAATGNGPSNGFYIGNGNGTLCYVWNYENDGIYFATNNTTRARILSGGEFAIGGSGYSGQPFSVQTSGNNLGYMQSTGTTRAVMNFVDGNSSVNNGFGCIGNNHVFMKDGNEKIRIDSYGVLRVGNTHSQQTSGNTSRIALGAKASIWGWASGQINGALTLADNYYWTGTQNIAIENDHSAYMSLRSGSLRFGCTSQTHGAGANISGGIHEKVRFENDGDVAIYDGNLSFASGHGIDFSSQSTSQQTNSPTVDDEVLQFYEKGKWTPDVRKNNVSNPAASPLHGRYVRIGQMLCHLQKF